MRHPCVSLLAGFLLMACCERAGAAFHPLPATRSTEVANSVVFLGTLGGPSGTAYGINESGMVVGEITTSAGGTAPFLWTAAGGMSNLGSFGGPARAVAINDQGHVVGFSRTSASSFDHAFLWTPAGGMVDLGGLPNQNSDAYDINNLEQVVGITAGHAFLWTATTGMRDLGTLAGTGSGGFSEALGISDFGHVVGQSRVPPSQTGPFHAFLWTAATGMKDLGTLLGGNASFASGVNNLGHVVGTSIDAAGRTRGFLWTPERGMEDLGTLPGGTTCEPSAINDQDQVVGWSSPNRRPFLWTRSTGMVELPTKASGGDARALNERGQIVGDSGGTTNGLPQPALWTQAATTFVVTKTVDTNDGACDGDCSLREAVIAANAHPSADVIVLPAGTYHLSIPGTGEEAAATGDLDITDSLTINGAGAANTIIDGGALDRVFHIHPGNSVQIRDLTIRNGSVLRANGGGIYNQQGFLTMVNCAVSGNVADGGSVPSIALIVRGGGLYTDGGTLTLDSCTLSGNQVRATASFADAEGGGMSVGAGTVNVRNSTFSGNSASSPSGGARGGGIFDAAGSINIQGTTITANSSAGSLAIIDQPTSVGGGIENQSGSFKLKLTGTIVAGNSAVVGPDCSGDTYDSGGYNLMGKMGTPCVFQTGIMTGNVLNADAKLGPLQDNRGPTFTHALLPGSPAIDVVPLSLCLGTDQRGIARPQGTSCDMGAFELITYAKRRVVRH